MNIYVGNLPFETKEDELRELFESFGTVESVKIIRDFNTGRSKGYGFIEMPIESEAQIAIENLNGKDVKGRNIRVNKAHNKRRGNVRRNFSDRYL